MATQGEKLAIATAATVISEPIMTAVLHGGPLGVILGLGVGIAAYTHAENVRMHLQQYAPGLVPPPRPVPSHTEKSSQEEELSVLYRLFHGKSTREALKNQVTVTNEHSSVRQEPMIPQSSPGVAISGQKMPVTMLLPLPEEDTHPTVVLDEIDDRSLDLYNDGEEPTISRSQWTPPQSSALEHRGIKPSSLDVLQGSPMTKNEMPKFHFSQLIRDLQFVPSLDKIYVGTLETGQHLFVAAKDMFHVATGGSTGKGKSALIRLLMAQLCYAGAEIILLDPHYTRYDREAKIPEDFTPFEPYLVDSPMNTRKYPVIEQYLIKIAKMVGHRLDLRAESKPVGKPFYLVIDELPAIVDHIPKASEYLKTILREGRKVGVFLILSSQDFLVKTIMPEGGASGIRKCFATTYYIGGDATTATALLDIPASEVPEKELGKGRAMGRNAAIEGAQRILYPYVDNDALYILLGPSTFDPSATNEEEGGEIQTVVPTNIRPFTPPIGVGQGISHMPSQRLTLEEVAPMPSLPIKRDPTVKTPTPVLPKRERLAEDVDFRTAIEVWNAMQPTIEMMETIFGLTNHQARKLRNKIIKLATTQQGLTPESEGDMDDENDEDDAVAQ